LSDPNTPQQPSEEELRAHFEEQLKSLRVQDVLLESVVSMVNLAARRAGLASGTDDEKDLDQVRVAIEALRALTPLLEQVAPQQAPALRDALSQLQMAYVRAGGEAPAEAGQGAPPPPGGAPPEPPPPGRPAEGEGGGPAQRSGRLWIPGQ
jgi:hypothetical protein